jgi:2,6-dihydroxypyridine 3-monooxygenase
MFAISPDSTSPDPTDPTSDRARRSGAVCPPLICSARQPRVAVIGASLTGPAAALLLLDAGFTDITVYEAAPAATTLGGGLISLEHSALDVLDRLGIAQDDYVNGTGETICQIAVRDQQPTDIVRRTYPGRFTTWTRLHRCLLPQLPPEMVHTGARLDGIAEHCGRPLLHFADGRETTADLIVFADGRNSAGRRLLDTGRQLRYAGYVAHRGSHPTHSDLTDFLRFEPGPGVQFNVAPIPGGIDWTFYLNATPGDYTDRFGAPPHRRIFALPQHVSPAARTHVDEHAAAHLPAAQAAQVHATAARMAVPVMDIDPPTRMVWPIGAGYAVLLGDALAPVRPHTARGANNGIEQAAGLAAALAQHRRHGADLAGALTGWQRRHLPTAVATVRQGPIIGARLGLGHPAGAR